MSTRFRYYFTALIVCINLIASGNPRIDSLNKLIVKYATLNIDSAIYFTKQGEKLAAEANLPKELAVFKNSLGQFYAMKGDFSTALVYFSENLATGKKTNNRELISRGDINIANIYVQQGKYNTALDHYLEALKINDQGSDKRLLYVNSLCLGITYYYLKNYEKSLAFYEKCLELSSDKKDAGQKAYCYNAMGIIRKEMQQPEEALVLFLKANAIAAEAADSSLLSHNTGNLGELYGLTGNYEKAIACIESGIRMSRRFQDNKGLGENLVLLGNTFVKFKKFKDAIAPYREALSIGERVGINEIRKDSHLGLSEAYAGLKDFENATEEHRLYSRIKDSLFNVTSSMQIADMQTRYDTEKKEAENTLLTKDNNIKTLQLEQQKRQRNLLIIGFALAALILGLLYNSNRLKNRNKILVEKELRTRAVFQAQEKEKAYLSQELHDGLGPLLSLVKLNISSLKPSEENRKLISELKDLTSQSIKEVRTISHALMPSLLQKQGLQAALSDFSEQVNQSGTLSTILTYDVTAKLSPEAEVNIYRIVQEAISNTIRHAGASEAKIVVTQKNDSLELRIADNGKGFSANSPSLRGNGLNNIYSRVDFMKGKIDIESGAGTGTIFIIFIP
ncbi:MAG: tetratricopeptide repeat protein, partial [Bacteroidia bacterium]